MMVDPVTVHRGEGFHVFPMVQLQADLGGCRKLLALYSLKSF